MKWNIFICVLILILLSGCLDVITTRQKQLCLSVTDFSKTSIYDCDGFSNCFKKIDTYGFVISEDIPFETKNKILIYKNNISSSVYYFNNAEKEIQKIYDYCSGEKDLKIIDAINKLTFYISRIFNYQDLSWQKSIEILKDYAIYLKKNGVEEISEEEIYSDFVLINKNLNELREENIESNTYVSILKNEAKTARDLASEFGFLKSYMANINYIDLYAYYSDYIENPEQEIKIPLISKSSDFMMSKFSTFENFRRINKSLARTDNYNLYILFDKHLGTKDSLFTRFVSLNNKINKDLVGVSNKIKELEKDIETNWEIIEKEELEKYKKYKKEYNDKKLGFGYYLAKLKELTADVEANKIDLENENSYKNKKLNDCSEIIKIARTYNNLYFVELINSFDASKTIDEKLTVCQKIENALENTKNCFLDLEKLINAGILDSGVAITEKDCVEILNQLNYNLENTENLSLYLELLARNLEMLDYLTMLDTDIDLQIKIFNLKEALEAYQNKQNYEIVLEIKTHLAELQKINKEITALWKLEIANELLKNTSIIYQDGKYYLEIFNSIKNLENICFKANNLNIKSLVSLNENLKIKDSEFCVLQLFSGNNRFLIDYKNAQKISTRIIKLGLDESLLETLIKNDVLGIKNTLNLGQISLVNTDGYNQLPTGEIEYITEKENKILYYSRILEKTNLEKDVEVLEDLVITNNKFKLKSLYFEKVCGKLAIEECQDCFAKAYINGVSVPVDVYENYGFLSVYLCLEEHEEKIIEINYIQKTENVESKINDLLTIIYKLNNCEFEEIAKESKSKFLNIYNKLIAKDKYDQEDIQQILSIEEDIKVLENAYLTYQDAFDKTNLLISELLYFDLNDLEKKELENIENQNQIDPKKALQMAKMLKEKLQEKQEFQKTANLENTQNKIDQLIDLAKNTGTFDDELQMLFTQAKENQQTADLRLLETEINERVTTKSDEVYSIIKYFKEINVKDVLSMLDELTWVYSNIELKELYSVKYYPVVSLDDGVRLKKKLSFLDTVSFKESANAFLSAQDLGDNLSALKKIDMTTIERLVDLNKEINLLKTGMASFEKDANIEVTKLENNKLSKKVEYQKAALDIKKDFENKKYLNVIRDARLLMASAPEKNKINYQYFVAIGGCLILAIVGMTFKNNKPKKLSKDEKKQKILRHY